MAKRRRILRIPFFHNLPFLSFMSSNLDGDIIRIALYASRLCAACMSRSLRKLLATRNYRCASRASVSWRLRIHIIVLLLTLLSLLKYVSPGVRCKVKWRIACVQGDGGEDMQAVRSRRGAGLDKSSSNGIVPKVLIGEHVFSS